MLFCNSSLLNYISDDEFCICFLIYNIIEIGDSELVNQTYLSEII